MSEDEPINQAEQFEEALRERKNGRYLLRLFVAGNTPRSAKAIENIREICEKNLKGRYTLEVVDISQQPELAREAQVLTAPTLVKLLPPPLRRMIGDLSDFDRVLVGLNIKELDQHEEQDLEP